MPRRLPFCALTLINRRLPPNAPELLQPLRMKQLNSLFTFITLTLTQVSENSKANYTQTTVHIEINAV